MTDRMLNTKEFVDRVDEHLLAVLEPYVGQRATFMTVLQMKQDVVNVLELFAPVVHQKCIEARANEIVRRAISQ